MMEPEPRSRHRATPVYNREEWRGRSPRETPVMYTPVTKVVLSRTETEPCYTHEDCSLRVREMQNIHMDEEGEPDIKYHFLVGGDGALYEGRGFTTVGRSYPTTANNLQDLSKNCLEIAFIQTSDMETTEEMQNVASHVMTLGRHANHIYKTFDLYFVANNDIVHRERMGIKVAVRSNPESDKASTAENDPLSELQFERDEHGKPEMIEVETTEHATQSHVPLHDRPDTDEKGNDEDAKPVNFIYRHVWGAQLPKWIKALDLPISKVAVSFTETDPCHTQDECMALVRKLQGEHLQDEKEPDIKYNFLIGGDGQIYEGRGYTRVGPIYPPSARKIEELNGQSIDIAIIEKHAKEPTPETIKAISWCLSKGIHARYIDANFDTYYIANNEILHVQHPVPGAEKKLDR
ncbi:peptidoglycan-recognition protein LF-like isoform X2 [Macrosteles quadrilineatus]|uniref:peptidoglycan-recognition protein LF-like isoform X2 n=1 Tax=Macrosteles quadrilineatus TaxID=74068 RepID=UPI0023E1B3F4|nr:peptidoglycan-recognition protein LF-like isoform X2 [Macrosteles quadrilineatus]